MRTGAASARGSTGGASAGGPPSASSKRAREAAAAAASSSAAADSDEFGDDDADVEEGGLPSPASALGASPISRFFKGVVKVFVVHATPSHSQPWSVRPPIRSTSSGFLTRGVAGERLILTNAHSVEYASLVQVRRFGSPDKVTASVVAIAHDCDIAVLRVDDDSWWAGTRLLEFGDLPFLHDSVIVVGYPIGGDQLSVTAGIVSRIDYGMYSFSTREHICIQVDSAINSGNSGGPALDPRTGKIVGVAFQSLSGEEADNIGYVVPSSVVAHVLKEVAATGRAQPFGRLGFLYQLLENPHLKASLAVPAGSSGILVSRVVPVSGLFGKILPNDVITACDGSAIAE